MTRHFEVRYDPFKQTIVPLDTLDNVRDTVRDLKAHITTVTSALEKITMH